MVKEQKATSLGAVRVTNILQLIKHMFAIKGRSVNRTHTTLVLPILALVNVCCDHLLLIAIKNELTHNLKCDLICYVIVQT